MFLQEAKAKKADDITFLAFELLFMGYQLNKLFSTAPLFALLKLGVV
jgi:hypothetical protein